MDMTPRPERRRAWRDKFTVAIRGIVWAVAEGSSFRVHVPMTALVILCGFVLQVHRLEWCLLILCITIVLAAETFNSALEALARAVDQNHNASLGRALDMSGGAVLICSVGAAIVGLIIFIHRAAVMLQ